MHAYILGIIKEKSNEKVSSRDWTQLIMIAQQPTYFEIYLKCYQKFLNIKIFDLYIFFTWELECVLPLAPYYPCYAWIFIETDVLKNNMHNMSLCVRLRV